MEKIDSLSAEYARVRSRFPRDSERVSYDFFRLVDLTWNVKTSLKVLSARNVYLGSTLQHDLFSLVVVCSQSIDNNAILEKSDSHFLNCWILFKSIVDKMFYNGEKLEDELVLSLGKLLFLAALIFNLPTSIIIENVLTNPEARQPKGMFPASAEEIEFCNTLPSDLNGRFQSVSAILVNLRINLQFYVRKVDNALRKNGDRQE